MVYQMDRQKNEQEERVWVLTSTQHSITRVQARSQTKKIDTSTLDREEKGHRKKSICLESDVFNCWSYMLKRENHLLLFILSVWEKERYLFSGVCV